MIAVHVGQMFAGTALHMYMMYVDLNIFLIQNYSLMYTKMQRKTEVTACLKKKQAVETVCLGHSNYFYSVHSYIMQYE